MMREATGVDIIKSYKFFKNTKISLTVGVISKEEVTKILFWLLLTLKIEFFYMWRKSHDLGAGW